MRLTRSGPGLAAAGLAFAAGAGLFHLAPLPPLVGPGLAVLLPTLPLAWRLPLVRWPWWLLAGLVWAGMRTGALLDAPFPETLTRIPLTVEGRILSIPAVTGQATRFLFAVERTLHDGQPLPFTGRVRLSWYDDAPALQAGERWRLPVRLKPPHGYANPGGFDLERRLFEQGIRATGNLRRGEPPQRLDPGPGGQWLERWRQELADHLAAVLGPHRALGLVQGLTLGERSVFTPEDWETLNRTGTLHLVAISGFNIGLIAGALFFMTRRLWSFSARLTLWLAAPRAAALAALIGAVGYAGLAGFEISTQRALIMLAVILGALFWGRTLRPWHALSLALAGVLAWDPRAVLSPGFWLSFVAVALLLFHLGQRLPAAARDPWTRWGRAQWAVAIGLLPLLFLLFGQASLIAPPINLIAVPLFVPLLPAVLLASLLSLIPGGDWPLRQAADGLAWGLEGLDRLAAWHWAMIELPLRPAWMTGAALAGVLLLLAPRGLPGRWLGLVLFLPLALARPPVPDSGEVWFTLLDVGQGLAAVVQTRAGVLVYDTGPGFPRGFNTGDAVLVPMLRAWGLRRVDTLVISHADRDHAGGLAGLVDAVPVSRILSGEPERLAAVASRDGREPPPVTHCRAGMHWTWSGVEFRVLHPAQAGLTDNDASCVLRIAAGGRSILLTGDIGQGVERQLIAPSGAAVRSDILVASHHGSATATGAAWLDAVRPELVLVSAGYANRFGHPAPAVRERLAARGIPLRETAVEGAIELRLAPDGTIRGPWGWRARAGRLWTHRPTGGSRGGE